MHSLSFQPGADKDKGLIYNFICYYESSYFRVTTQQLLQYELN